VQSNLQPEPRRLVEFDVESLSRSCNPSVSTSVKRHTPRVAENVPRTPVENTPRRDIERDTHLDTHPAHESPRWGERRSTRTDATRESRRDTASRRPSRRAYVRALPHGDPETADP
jgi:hypothetical protein